ncbi:MAG TPA: type IV secretory system conjugative DNA transfer family protein [Ktedonobacteraceae bacterium]|nr:type IV secretory system conjugative DNA transfer family protein [Ktedonobacteraceae bacterium]
MRSKRLSLLITGLVLLVTSFFFLHFWFLPELSAWTAPLETPTVVVSTSPPGVNASHHQSQPTPQVKATPHVQTASTATQRGNPLNLKNSLSLYVLLAIILLGLIFLMYMTKKKPTTAHGSAHWATRWEVWRAKLVVTRRRRHHAAIRALEHGQRPPSFLPLGTYKGLRLALSEQQQEYHVSIIAPTGKRKTSTMIIPPLMDEDGHRSLFIHDTKGELAQKTWGALGRQHTCYQFAPTKPHESHCYNPLAHVHDMSDAEDLADSLIANTGKSQDPYWDNSAKLLITGVILHLLRTEPNPPFHRFVDLLCGTPPEEVKALLASSPSRLVRKVAFSFVNSLTKNERLEGAVFSELASRLFRMHNPSIVAITSKNEIDFHKMIQEPSALFLHIPQGDVERLKWLSATLIMQMMKAFITQSQEQPDKRLPRPFVFYLDEFCNAGHIPRFTKHISTVRSAGIAFILAMQDFGQLEDEYGEEGKNSILSNTTHKIFFPGCGLPESNYASECMGDTTVLTYSESDRPATEGGFFAPNQRAFTTSETRRRLLTPDEVHRMREGTALLLSDTTPPVLLKTTSYVEDAAMREKTRLPYIPPSGPGILEDNEDEVVGAPMLANELVAQAANTVPSSPESTVLPVPDEE